MMKNRYLTFLAFSLLAVASCKNPTDDFVLAINPAFYKYVVNVELLDLVDPDLEITDADVNISIDGPSAENIYNIDGTKNYSVNFGAIQLITDRTHEPTPGNPLRFTITVASNKFRTQILPIVVNEGEYYIDEFAFLLDLNRLPAGTLDKVSTSGSLQANGQLTQPLVITTDPNTGNTSQMTMTIPNDIQFLDAAGQPLSGGNLSVEVISFSDTTETAQIALPNNTGSNQRMMVDGEALDVFFDEGPTFEINMSVGTSKVKSFTGNGVQLSIPLPDHMYNWEEDRAYQAGDVLGFYSYSDGDSTWQVEDDVVVELIAGQLVIKPTIKHLSIKKADKKVQRFLKQLKRLPSASSTPSKVRRLTVKLTKLNPRSSKKYYRTAILRLPFDHTVQRKISLLPNTLIKSIQKSPLSSPIINRITRNVTRVNATFTQNTADNTVEVEITDDPNAIRLGYKLYCEESNAYVYPPAGVKLFYRETGSTEGFELLYTFTGEDQNNVMHRIPGVEAGKFYDFQALFNSHQADTSNVQAVDSKIYEIDMPKAACDELL